ncbi:MAG: high frequency lysogenization protein HflD [Erythrobacter sp.]|jgi:hypothetical protein
MSSLLSILALGTLAGMGHSLEADHVAAVSSIVAGDRNRGSAASHGLSWGIGHTLTLLLVSVCALILGQSISPGFERRFELVVGFMLVALGLNLVWRMHRQKMHFHGHVHGGERPHFHGHSHRDEAVDHRRSPHRHIHRLRPRALFVGMIHGLAGSAALLVVTATQLHSWQSGLLYVVLFGTGSILGMTLLSLAIALPLRLAGRWLTAVGGALQMGLACLTIFIGSSVVLEYW